MPAPRDPNLLLAAARAYYLESFRHERTDPAIYLEMGEMGLLGVTIPTAYGGAGLGHVTTGLAHVPNGSAIGGLASACLEESVCHCFHFSEKSPATRH